MALTTLGSFDFSGHVLSEFARQRALPYLEDDHPEVRQAAALTCCRLYARDPICHQASAHAIEVMSEVLDKLLVVGIADPGECFAVSRFPFHAFGVRDADSDMRLQTRTSARSSSPTSKNASIATLLRQRTFARSSSLSTTRCSRIAYWLSRSSDDYRSIIRRM